MIRKPKIWFPFLFLVIVCNACMDDDRWLEMNNQISIDIEQSGLFVVNEGNFMYDNASLSFYQIDSMKVLNSVFFRTNGVVLGDVAYSMSIRDSLGYIVVNNSGKVFAININTFEYAGVIEGLTSPRHIHFINDQKAYVTDLYAKSIAIIDPSTFEVIGQIDVDNPGSDFYQHPTEEMVQFGKYVFTNCWSYDNKILVIDSDTDQVVDSIEVPRQPNSLVIDKNHKIWSLSDGGFAGNPYGQDIPALVRIDAETREIEETIQFDMHDNPSALKINGSGDTLYFINQHVYSLPVGTAAEAEMLIESPYKGSYDGGFYGLAVDPSSGDIYLADAIDNVQQGLVYRYKPNGMAVDTFKVGIIPGAFCFKP